MDRNKILSRARSSRILLACSLAFLSTQALAAGVEVDGTTNTKLRKAANGVAIVDIASPNRRGLSHNKYNRFNVQKSGMILNNSKKSKVDTQLGGKIRGNSKLSGPARVILNEVTSTNPSILKGYTEVAGKRADIVIANPNGITINGAGFINSSRVTLTTGVPTIDAPGNLVGFDVGGGEIRIEGKGLNTQAQDATSIYSHFLKLNAKLHAQDLDIALGLNQIDYPGRKIVSSRNSSAKRVLLDSSALGGMYTNKIVLVGTDQGLGMNLPAAVIASTGDIRISSDGHLQLQQLDAGRNIELQTAQGIESSASVYAKSDVTLQAGEVVKVVSGMIAAGKRLSIDATELENEASLLAGLISDGSFGGAGELTIKAQQLQNKGEIVAIDRIDIVAGDISNQGLMNAGNELLLSTDSLFNEATLFSAGNARLQVRDSLHNSVDASIFAVNDLVLAADSSNGKTAQITNQLGLIQSLYGDIDIFANRFDNLGEADLQYKIIYYDHGKGRRVNDLSAAMRLNLAYSTGYTKHKATARARWVNEILDRIRRRAPELYKEVANDIRVNRATNFLAISTRLLDKSTTTPAYLDSGGDLNLYVDEFTNMNSVTAAAGDIHFEVSGDYRNVASRLKKKVTDYRYYVWSDHDTNWKDEDKYSSSDHAGYIPKRKTRYVSANTVTQAGGVIDGEIGGKVVNKGVLKGKYHSSASLNPAKFDKSRIKLPKNDFGLFVLTTDPDSQYLIETNPQFNDFGNFTSSDYLLKQLDFSSGLTLKRLGDAFYESKLIRESVFAQSGQRYLDASLASDNEQFRYLMDNALLAQKTLNLVPGIALSRAQIDRLTRDIVWLEQKRIGGENVLVPTVYLASGPRSEIRGGRIVSGGDTRLQVAALVNSGLIESDANLDVDADDEVENRGLLIAADDIVVSAENDIANISGRIEADNVSLTSRQGDIINQRDTEEFSYSDGDLDFKTTLLDDAAVIHASGTVRLEAAGKIKVEGSTIAGRDVNLETLGYRDHGDNRAFRLR